MAKPPSTAQAKRLAELWATDSIVKHYPGINPTIDVLVRRGWVHAHGEEFCYPNGAVGGVYVISNAGIEALAEYFRKTKATALPSDTKAGKGGA